MFTHNGEIHNNFGTAEYHMMLPLRCNNNNTLFSDIMLHYALGHVCITSVFNFIDFSVKLINLFPVVCLK